MIKDKDCWEGRQGFETPDIGFQDGRNELTPDLVRQYLEESFQEANIPVSIAQDDFQYKTGFMKSETCPCLVVTSAEKGDDLSRYIVAVKKVYENNTTVAVCSWYGESLSTRLLNERNKKAEKYNKGLDKQRRSRDRSANDSDVIIGGLSLVGKMAGHAAINKLKEGKIDKLEYEYEQARIGEDEYYIAVSAAVTSALNKIAEKYPSFKLQA